MAYEQRTPLDYRFGQLTATVTSLDTTLTSAAFASLPSDLSAAKYLPITLADDSLGVYEVVWVTGHTAGSTAVTVVRGREGSTPRAWSQGAVWRAAPLARDTLTVLSRASLPTDAHTGMRVMLADENQVVEKGPDGWMSPFGSGAPRRRILNQTIGLAGNTETKLTALSQVAAPHNVGPATYSGGNVYLNRAGFWRLTLEGSSSFSSYGWFYLLMRWASDTGPWPGDQSNRQTLPNGFAIVKSDWLGYVTATQAAMALGLFANRARDGQTANENAYVQFTAEYLGG